MLSRLLLVLFHLGKHLSLQTDSKHMWDQENTIEYVTAKCINQAKAMSEITPLFSHLPLNSGG